MLVLLPLLAHGLTVWPKPQQQVNTDIVYNIDPVQLTLDAAGPGANSPILLDAFKRYRALILHTWGHGRDTPRAASTIASVLVTVASADQSLQLETDCAYNLTISAPTIKISANTVFGALNGLESLSQLVAYATVNGTTIRDWPRYQFRATMIDTSRHYYPVECAPQDANHRLTQFR
jgi:hexosaminidase